MTSLFTYAIYIIIIYSIFAAIKKGSKNKNAKSPAQQAKPAYGSAPRPMPGTMQDRRSESGSMPHNHRESGVYDSYNRKNARNDSGTMPHKHSMSDASKLPPGYILLNGEPVRVADLEGK